MRELLRTLKLVLKSAAMNVGSMASYRSSTVWSLISTFLWTASVIVFFEALYGNFDNLFGYDKADMYVFLGVGQIFAALFSAVIWPGSDLKRLILSFDLDNYLLKPVNQMIYVTLKYVDVDDLTIFVPGILALAHAFSLKSFDIGILQIVLFLLAVIIGFISLYLMQQFFQLLTFWLVEDIGKYTLGNSMDISRYPKEMYGKGIVVFLLTFIFPMMLYINLPVHILIGGAKVWWAGVLVGNAVILSLVVGWMWRKGVARYADVD